MRYFKDYENSRNVERKIKNFKAVAEALRDDLNRYNNIYNSRTISKVANDMADVTLRLTGDYLQYIRHNNNTMANDMLHRVDASIFSYVKIYGTSTKNTIEQFIKNGNGDVTTARRMLMAA